MPVAPSFTNYKIITENPFLKNGKLYITVQNPNTGNNRDVRWYSEDEYAKAYGKKVAEPSDKGFPMLKHARGFDKGPILVIRNDRPADEPWLCRSNARYAVGIGWYIVSEETLPEDAPAHFKYLLLSWDEFRNGDDFHMKSPEQIAEILRKKAIKREWFKING